MAKIDSAVATQTKGEADAWYRAMQAWIVLTSCATLAHEPRWMAGWLTRPNQRSTGLRQETAVGVQGRG